ncbi:MAG: hydroxyacylglutathione hydrolase [Mariprofundaceae bacterium]|nr:hydroxyacylglutathione hydrolase [Mariprofundaceae bacterium]
MNNMWQYSHTGFQVLQIPTLRDNYTYMVLPDDLPSAWVIDPADAGLVVQSCQLKKRWINHIWNTHHHWDHTDGNDVLREKYDCVVHAAKIERLRIPSMTHELSDHESWNIDGLTIEVLAVPGHTDGHLAFLVGNALFCGDALFSAGCGRLFEGTPAQMLGSLQRLMSLPDATLVYCAHEYTLMNLQFARAVADSLADRTYHRHCLKRQSVVTAMRHDGQPSVPVLLKEERLFNPFLQVWHERFCANYAQIHGTGHSPLAVFTHMRQWRNNFLC